MWRICCKISVKVSMFVVILLLIVSIKSCKNGDDDYRYTTEKDNAKHSMVPSYYNTVHHQDNDIHNKGSNNVLHYMELLFRIPHIAMLDSYDYINTNERKTSCENLTFCTAVCQKKRGCGHDLFLEIGNTRTSLKHILINRGSTYCAMVGNVVRLSFESLDHLRSQRNQQMDIFCYSACSNNTIPRYAYIPIIKTVNCTNGSCVLEQICQKNDCLERKQYGLYKYIIINITNSNRKSQALLTKYFENISFCQNKTFLVRLCGFLTSNLAQILISFYCMIHLSRLIHFKENTLKYDASLYGKQKYDSLSIPQGEFPNNLSLGRKFSSFFAYTPPFSVTVYPFSINNMADDIVKKQKKGEELMRYEWSRYLSFKTFPDESIMMPLRLAQSGFFYTGHDQEVKCFCCGVVNDSWSIEETVMQVHRRISPDCKFIRGESTENVSIHTQDYNSNSFGSNADGSAQTHTDSGATGGPCDVIKTDSINGSKTNQKQHQDHVNITKQQIGSETRQNSSGKPNMLTTHSRQNRCYMKHPEYADFSARLATYQNWTFLDIQDPAELAEAGLYYVGHKDCVRCYFCGIGLKNWEYGDNPWFEHERWSNRCGHIAGEQPLEYRADETVQTEVCNRKNGNENETPEVNHGTKQVGADIDSIAARSVLEMGYSKEIVSEAILKFRKNNGNGKLSGSAIMDIILDSHDPESKTTTQIETPLPTHTNTPVSKVKQRTKKSNAHGTDAKSLVQENRALKEQKMCKICLDLEANVVFLPCGHMVSCQTCAVGLRKCAICRELIRGTVRVYQS